jgi:hypothetical protein
VKAEGRLVMKSAIQRMLRAAGKGAMLTALAQLSACSGETDGMAPAEQALDSAADAPDADAAVAPANPVDSSTPDQAQGDSTDSMPVDSTVVDGSGESESPDLDSASLDTAWTDISTTPSDVNAQPSDAGPDSGLDANPDSAPFDGGPVDASTDSGPVDGGPVDANPDSPFDGGPVDARTDSGPIDSGSDSGEDGAVDSGVLTTEQVLNARGGTCLACAQNAGCINPDAGGVDCEELSGTDDTNCIDTLQCVLTGCGADGGMLSCLCGTLDADACASAAAPNGPCKADYFAGFGTDNVAAFFNSAFDPTTPPGNADSIDACLAMKNCADCF